MNKVVHKKIKMWVCLAMFFVALSSCLKESEKSAKSKCDDILLKSFIESHRGSMMEDPYSTLNIFKKERENTVDSISSYQLLCAIAYCYQWVDNLDSAMLLLKNVIDFCKRSEPSLCLNLLHADACTRYSSCWADFHEHDSALFYCHKALDLINDSNYPQPDLLLKAYLFLAVNYEGKGDVTQASNYYHKAMLIADSDGNVAITTNFIIFLSLAKLYSNIENFEMAEIFFQQAEKYLDEIPEAHRFLFYNFRGIYYMKMKDYPKALDIHRQYYRYNLFASVPLPYNCAMGAANVGEMFLRMQQTDSARYYINHAKEHFEQSYEFPAFKFHLEGLSAMLALQENKLNEAQKLLSGQMAYDITHLESYIVFLHYQLMEELYAKKSDYENAYKYRLKVDAHNDSLRNTQIHNKLAEIEMRFKQDTTLLRKDLRIAVAEGRASRWQSIAATILFSFTLLAALAGGLVFYSRRKREQKYRRQMDTVTELRMQIVRNRLSPHFVFNALNIMMPTMGQHKELEQHFNVLIQLLRNNLSASEQMAVPLYDEINLVKNYLQLQELSNPERMKVDWQLASDVPQDTRIPSMTIQIPVENAVKYAFTSGQEDARIEINISRQINDIHIIIEDNGIGYRPGAEAFSERGTGSGLKMLHRTVDLLNLRNSAKMVFKIENRQQLTAGVHGTRVIVTVPIDYRFDM